MIREHTPETPVPTSRSAYLRAHSYCSSAAGAAAADRARHSGQSIGAAGGGHELDPVVRERSAGRALSLVCLLGIPLSAAGCAVITLRPAPADVPQEPPTTWDYREWATVLRENVRDGLVDYAHLKDHRQPLDRFLGGLSVVGPKNRPELFKTRGDRAAYWINAYNALVLRVVLERYPVETMYGLADPALEADYQFPVDQRMLNLLTIKEELREVGRNDTRVMFCLCAAAKGAPPLVAEPFQGYDLERRLRETARAAVSNRNMARIDHVNRKLLVWFDLFSGQREIVGQYERRYRTRGATLLTVLNTFADSRRRGELAAARGYKVEPLPFDRSLNLWKPAR